MESEKTPLLTSRYNSTHFPIEDASDLTIGYKSNGSLGEEAGVSFSLSNSVSVDKSSQIALSWRDVSVSAVVTGQKSGCCGKGQVVKPYVKDILKDVSGVVQSGSLLAIMGASGAGKSTLLNVLTQRNLRGYTISGDVRVNGTSVGEGIRHISAYVQQDDLFFSNLTVREQLEFRAMLRMDNRLTKQDRLDRVNDIIQEMGLSKCSDSRIGDAGGATKGISGGERKRLSFASEMLTNPPIFFCDEPTSGLDSFMAQSIVQCLQNMASKGRTILCTIHQPSSDVFSMFNRILLLSEGRTAFLGAQTEAMEFFQNSLNYPCPNNYNPADHYISTLAIAPDREQECKQKATAICDAFLETPTSKQLFSDIDELNEKAKLVRRHSLIEAAAEGDSRYESSWWTQFRYLFWRCWITIFRDVILFRVRCGQAIVVSLLFSLIYFRIHLDQKGVQDINGALFLLITFTSFSNMFAVVNTFPVELPIFVREYGSGLYRVDTYYLTKSISELPVFFVISIVFSTICYWMMGFYESLEAYLVAVAILLLVANVAVSLGYILSALCGSVTIALAIAPPILIPFMVFGGLFINADNIPVYFIWMQYLSWFKYANEVLAINQWQNIDYIPCDNVNATANGDRQCPYRNGDDVLDLFSFDKDNWWLNIGLLFALLVLFRIISFIVLLIRSKRSRG